MVKQLILATRFPQNKVSTVWKTMTWERNEVSGGYPGTMRELTEKKKIGLSDAEKREHTTEVKPCS